MEKVFDYEGLKLTLETSDGFMIALTTLHDGKLQHYLLTDKFPNLDILPSLHKSRELAVERLEGPDA